MAGSVDSAKTTTDVSWNNDTLPVCFICVPGVDCKSTNEPQTVSDTLMALQTDNGRVRSTLRPMQEKNNG